MEYAVVAVCLVAALVAMSVYVKRAMQGRLRQAGDELGEQYAPKNTTGTITTTVSSRSFSNTTYVNETQMYDQCMSSGGTTAACQQAADLNEDGDLDSDVVAMHSRTELINETSTQSGNETVGALENKLY